MTLLFTSYYWFQLTPIKTFQYSNRCLRFNIAPKKLDFEGQGINEPLFGTMAIYDLREKCKITEDYPFHVNNDEALRLISKSPSLMQEVEKILPKCQFALTETHEEMVLVVVFYRIMTCDVDEAAKPYSKDLKDIEKAKLRAYYMAAAEYANYTMQPFLWGFTSLFGYLSNNQLMLNVGLMKISSLYRIKNEGISHREIIELISHYSDKWKSITGSFYFEQTICTPSAISISFPTSNDLIMSAVPPLPLVASFSRSVDHSPAVTPREAIMSSESESSEAQSSSLQVGSAPLPSPVLGSPVLSSSTPSSATFNTATLSTSLDSQNLHSIRKFSVSSGSDADCKSSGSECGESNHSPTGDVPESQISQPLEPEDDKLFKLCELPVHISKTPFLSYMNTLFLYPETAHFEKAAKILHVSIEAVFRTNDDTNIEEYVLPRIVSRYGNVRTKSLRSSSHFKVKSPVWLDEIRVDVPVTLSPKDHILFIFHNKNEKSEKKVLGYAFLPLLDEGYINQREEFHLTVFSSLKDGYLHPDKQRILDVLNKKSDKFVLHTRLLSTIYPRDKEIRTFFQRTSELQKQRKYTDEAGRALRFLNFAMDDIRGVDFKVLTPHLPVILQMLLNIIANASKFTHDPALIMVC